MKKLLTASLPALALLALGSCTATRSVATTEDDGVYYSSKDRTTAVVRPAVSVTQTEETAPAATGTSDEATNPDYAASSPRQARNAPEYYDDSYSSSAYDPNARFHQPYAGPTVGLAYYSPPVTFAPAIVSYGYSPYSYGGYGSSFYDPFYSSYASPYSYYQPYGLYDPFYSPFSYGASYVSINIGFGRPWGGYGYGYGNPYGVYAYNPYGYGGYGRSYYGGGGYYGGGYGGGYYNNRTVIRPGGSGNVNYAENSSPVLVGPRRGRGGDVLAGRNNAAPTNPNPSSPTTNGRGRRGGIVADPAPIGGLTAPTAPGAAATGGDYGRRRISGDATVPNRPTEITDHDTQPRATGRRSEDVTGSRLGSLDPTAPTPTASPDANTGSRRRWRDLNNGDTTPTDGAGRSYGQSQPADAQPTDRSARRGRLSEAAPDNGQNQPTRTYERPAEQPQRVYERPQRTYEQPAQTQRTYERPAQTERTYERPSQPSYSSPSSGGNSGGGSNSGGGGGGRRGGRF